MVEDMEAWGRPESEVWPWVCPHGVASRTDQSLCLKECPRGLWVGVSGGYLTILSCPAL